MKKKINLSNIGAVCFDCARKSGFTLKEGAVGVWTDECGICHEQKPCTNLHHDWRKAQDGGAE